MIKNLFIKFGLWLAKDEIQKIKFEANSKAELKETEREKSKLIIQEYEVEYVMGKKIIYCSNEWSDPDFGTVVGVEYHTTSSVPMLKCKNALYGHPGFITEEFFYVKLGTYLIADELMTNAVLKLNPFERWNLTTGKSFTTSNMWVKWYPEKKELSHPFVLEKALREVGFMLPLSAANKLISMGQLSSPRSVFDFFWVNREEKVISYRRNDALPTTRVKSIKLNTDEQLQEVLTILGLQENNEEQNG